jgi:D-xylose transport system permease protein
MTTVVQESTELPAPPPQTHNGLAEHVKAYLRRVRGGEMGALPALSGILVLVIGFSIVRPVFFTAGNFANLLPQSAAVTVIAMGLVFVLLLGEIDLSAGFNAAIGATVTAWVAFDAPWWVAILAGLAATSFFGGLQGTLITRLRLPSFVVTLAGLLGLEGLLIILIARSGHGPGGTIPISNPIIDDLTTGNLSPIAGWIVMIVIVVIAGASMILRDRRRRASNLVAPPVSVTILKVAVIAVAGVAVVLVGNANRGRLLPLRGVPWVVFVVLGLLALWSALLSRTRFGRYVYAIGGNAEAARRAGVNLTMIRTLAFTLCGLTAGAAGVIYASRLGSISNNIDGGQLVLFAVASAVIGGTHLFGGVGRMLHALLGGIVVAAIYNGLGLLGMSAAATDIVTALVLLAAVTVDTLARRGGRSTA